MSRSATNIAILLAGIVGGWASALYSIQSLGSAPADDKGLWSTWDSEEGGNNPYAVAHYLLEGQIPPAIGLFRTYFTDKDDNGEALDASCTYKVTTAADNSLRWWSFATGRGLTGNAVSASTITSELALATTTGVEITVSPHPESGNWLRPPESSSMQFAFMVASDSKLDDDGHTMLPVVRKARC